MNVVSVLGVGSRGHLIFPRNKLLLVKSLGLATRRMGKPDCMLEIH